MDPYAYERLYYRTPPPARPAMASANFVKKIFLIVFLIFFLIMVLLSVQEPNKNYWNHRSTGKESVEVVFLKPANIFEEYERTEYNFGKWRSLSDDEIGNMSTLGRVLFLDEKPVVPNESSKFYKILVWKYGKTTEKRHLKNYGDKYIDPFAHCLVKNCNITFEDQDIADASIVIYHMHRMKGISDLPRVERNPNQIWAFLIDESPYHVFLNSRANKLTDYNGVFNWSMTYRFRSDIPVPYGRTVPLLEPDDTKVDNLDYWKKSKKSNVLIAIMGSNCGSKNHRWEYVHTLKKEIPVDIYGACGNLKCPGHFDKDCEKIGDYMFYLSFENSNCEEYITEKLWWNAYKKNSIPIIMGDKESNLAKLLPPHSYINVENFASPRDLANYIRYLIQNPSELQLYFQWKKYFQVVQEHGYFQSESFHYCRVCEALNFNSREKKIYDHLEDIWGVSSCYPKWDDYNKD